MNKKIIFSSGGTGGHIFPAINLMRYFSNKGYRVLLVTDRRGSVFLKNYTHLQSYVINADTPLNKNILRKFLSLLTIFFSIAKSILILRKERPDLVIGFGGYVSFPVSFSSRFYNIPLVIYENNLVLGRTNKKLLSLSKRLLLGTEIPINFPKKCENKVYKVGNILREEIINYSAIKKKNNFKFFSILVLGGSQGAEIFGEIIPSVIKMLKDKGYMVEINQQCLEKQKKTLTEYYKKNDIKSNIFDFTNNILDLISSTDLAISRSGASTTAELVNMLTPFIAVPYPSSMDNHQHLNAKYYESKGCCWVIEQDKFNITNLFNLITEIMNDKKKLEDIRKCMKKNENKDVYVKIENAIREFI
jgi:UDP-N-acetylglucosamine--N-acetylmuramyl-(pentapeptide) pyrophosphoryl-undecaprenol N-acetylglucosamine transferase